MKSWLTLPSLVACAVAQPLVVPSSVALVEGNSLDREPFGHEAIRHVTYYHQDLLRTVPWQAQINRISYRRDTTVPQAVLRRPPGIWQIRLGNYRGSVAQPPSAWPASSDPDWVLAFQPRQISFPDLTKPTSGPAPFQLTFWLDRPVAYTGNHLGVEHFVFDARLLHDYFVDAVDGLVPGGAVDVVPGSVSCPFGMNRVAGQAPNPGGGDLELYLFDALPSVAAAVTLGVSNSNWNGQPLPLDLTYLGLTGCSLQASIDSIWATRTTSAGMAQFRVPVPGQPSLVGATLYSQWLVADGRVNPAVGFATSEAARISLGNYLNSGFVGMSVVSAFSGSNQNGYVQPNRGLVLELNW